MSHLQNLTSFEIVQVHVQVQVEVQAAESGFRLKQRVSRQKLITPARLRDPQQLNQYLYERNNPLRFIDSNGETLTIRDAGLGIPPEIRERFQAVAVVSPRPPKNPAP